VKRSNLAFFNEIATHLSGARNDRLGKQVLFLNRDLGYPLGLTVYQFLIKYILLVADWRKEEGAYPWKTEF
jgi:hypothetical protein